ncbi:CHAP domain-containing protein (fragment) [Pseudomonas sp. 8AS]|uniref:CHAP domain-containing protein n=1 Tax=Pseudomonas sp. 8AS TaxID=2653163 RepID=UPI0012F2E5A7
MKGSIKAIIVLVAAIGLSVAGYQAVTRVSLGNGLAPGSQIDELHGVAIYYNGGVNQSRGRNTSADGYNLGIRYQCVEFVKRYYFERFGHRMPDAYGHAKSFFDHSLADGAFNEKRGLLQFSNGAGAVPQAEDILVFGPSLLNPYGHVGIVAQVNSYAVIIAQQNAGPILSSREALPLVQQGNGFRVENARVVGWLRLPAPIIP